MLPPPLRFLLRSFRLSSSARWLSCCRAAVAVAELFAAAAAGDTLRCCFLVSYPALRRLCWSLLLLRCLLPGCFAPLRLFAAAVVKPTPDVKTKQSTCGRPAGLVGPGDGVM